MGCKQDRARSLMAEVILRIHAFINWLEERQHFWLILVSCTDLVTEGYFCDCYCDCSPRFSFLVECTGANVSWFLTNKIPIKIVSGRVYFFCAFLKTRIYTESHLHEVHQQTLFFIGLSAFGSRISSSRCGSCWFGACCLETFEITFWIA